MNLEIKSLLENSSYKVDIYSECEDVYNASLCKYDLFLLDNDVPEIKQIDLVKHIRKINKNSEIVIIGSSIDINVDYEQNCYDFIKKPFSTFELLLKINKIKREKKKVIVNEDIIYYKELGRLSIKEVNSVQLSKKEDMLFNLLLSNRGRVISRNRIIDFLYESNKESALSSLINRLRNKIPNGIIKTSINGMGYIIE